MLCFIIADGLVCFVDGMHSLKDIVYAAFRHSRKLFALLSNTYFKEDLCNIA